MKLSNIWNFTKITYSSNIYALLTKIFTIFSNIHWQRIQAFLNGGKYWKLTEQDHDIIRVLLKPSYYFILTRRNCHLTTYLIELASLIATGKIPHYTHALMNVDDGNIKNDYDFRLIEATAPGVHWSTFMEVFDCDSVVLLKPKNLTAENWTKVLDKALAELGKDYDNLFDIIDETHVSCVEMCRQALQAEPNYSMDFAKFEKMIKDFGNKLIPQMLYECSDFEIVFEARR